MESNFAMALPKAYEIIDKGMSDGLHLGGQLYISKAGITIIDTGFGMREPGILMQPEDLMLWLSNTKPLMAVVFGQLLESTSLSLKDPVAQWIPEFAVGGKDSILIEHLLMHTGGIRHADTISENFSWDETIARICAMLLDPEWIPGETAGYHVSGSWFILGEIVRRIIDEDLSRTFIEKLFAPLGMQNSRLSLSAAEWNESRKRLAPMFIASGGNLNLHPVLNAPEYAASPRPGSSGRGPIRELGLLYEMLLRSGIGIRGNVIKPETSAMLVTRSRIGKFDQTFRHIIDWGLGFIVNSNQYGAETLPYSFGRHASADTFGHGGAQSSSAYCDPKNQLVVAWAFNGMPGEVRHKKRGRELNSAIYEDLGLAVPS
ncbi:MAG: Serine hydrolase [Verrucomicrobiales bacterium]|nr:Serine hydrolase [Verrucomicrobiales bacterium]